MAVRLWVFLSVIAVVKAYGNSDVVLDFLSVISGKFESSVFSGRFVPVNLPAFRPKTMVYFESALNGTVYIMLLCEVKEDTRSKNTVLLEAYVFNTSKTYKAGEFELYDLYDVTPGDITRFKHCQVEFETAGNGTFSTPCHSCSANMSQPHPLCHVTFDCDAITLDRPASASQIGKAPNGLYRLNGPRYPLVHVPKGYVSPCDTRNRQSTTDKYTV